MFTVNVFGGRMDINIQCETMKIMTVIITAVKSLKYHSIYVTFLIGTSQ